MINHVNKLDSEQGLLSNKTPVKLYVLCKITHVCGTRQTLQKKKHFNEVLLLYFLTLI